MEKRYFSIGEIAEELGVSVSQIRKWETELQLVKPVRSEGRTRKFTAKNLEELREIKSIIDKYGIRGDLAKGYLKNKVRQQRDKEEAIEKLQGIKAELQSWLEKVKV